MDEKLTETELSALESEALLWSLAAIILEKFDMTQEDLDAVKNRILENMKKQYLEFKEQSNE